ncbi:SDR family oxidoreductase [Tsukamurella ocularis]|uniref:SDR family oxidoreductase n=1 Tax=Tsukamurella ocularis TaxID=1970234 RepID=UPI0039EEC38F
MDLHLDGRVYVVSGASAGIGAAIADALIAEGARVCGFSRTGSELDDGRRLFVRADAGDDAAVAAVVRRCRERFGRIDGVVANAGRGGRAAADAPIEMWRNQFDVKVAHAVNLVEAAHQDLQQSEHAAIVLINAVSAHTPDSGMAPVCAARAALASYAVSLSDRLASDGIRVVCVNVGVIDTERQRERHRASGSGADYPTWREAEAARRGVPLRRMGVASEVADTVAFLLSPRSAYTTGTSIDVAGGLSARM